MVSIEKCYRRQLGDLTKSFAVSAYKKNLVLRTCRRGFGIELLDLLCELLPSIFRSVFQPKARGKLTVVETRVQLCLRLMGIIRTYRLQCMKEFRSFRLVKGKSLWMDSYFACVSCEESFDHLQGNSKPINS